ncbi:MAG: hypothetical protein ABWY29_05645 [Blastococcus sp.]
MTQGNAAAVVVVDFGTQSGRADWALQMPEVDRFAGTRPVSGGRKGRPA